MSPTPNTKGMNKFEEKIFEELLKCSFEGCVFEGKKLNYVKPEPLRVYTPDFHIFRDDGSELFLETKGYFRPESRTKMRHVKRCNPSLDIRIIFQENRVITKRTGFDYLKWAERNKFPCAIGTLPTEWLK